MTEKEVTSWIEDWCNLFPDGVVFGGYNIKTDPKHCIKKMLNFTKVNPQYSKECIFAATKQYLLERYAQGWQYTKQATYFISKVGEVSLLQQYCERVLKGIKPATETEAPIYNPINDFI